MTETLPWLERTREAAIEPELPVCDPHHHLWVYPNSRYLLDELLADIDGGHRVLSTVYVECQQFYRTGGPAKRADGATGAESKQVADAAPLRLLLRPAAARG